MLSLEKGVYLGIVDKLICDRELIGSITSYSESSAQREMHCHDNAHISFVLHGGNLERRRNTETQRIPGTISFYNSGEYHQSTIIANPSKHINLELLSLFFSEYDISESDLEKAITTSPDSKFLMTRMLAEMIADDELSVLSMRMLILGLVNRSTRSFAREKKPGWIGKIDELLRDDPCQQLSLSNLSSLLSIHPVTISRQFHSYHSCTLGEYIRKLRIEKSLALIKDPRFTLTEIAFECGFADQSHFTRTFKRYTGLLPLVYKKL